MTPTEAGRIRLTPAFLELERKRSRFSWTLTVLMLVLYFGFILLVAFDKQLQLMGTMVTRSISLGFPLGLGVILSAIVLTGVYVLRANTEFDRLTREIVTGNAMSAAVPLRPVQGTRAAGGVR
ncbi:MAG: DUF485 domain-containing protein [Janthinobacterium lividum]